MIKNCNAYCVKYLKRDFFISLDNKSIKLMRLLILHYTFSSNKNVLLILFKKSSYVRPTQYFLIEVCDKRHNLKHL